MWYNIYRSLPMIIREGLVPIRPDQINSATFKEIPLSDYGTVRDLLRQGGRRSKNPTIRALTSLLLASALLVAACAPRPTQSPESSPIPPTATATATSEPPTPTPEPTATRTPTPEVKAFDNGIISPAAYTKVRYVQWETPNIGLSEAIVMNLEPGEQFKIPEAFQVAATEVWRGDVFAGYRIVAAGKNGHQIIYFGNIKPNAEIGKVGKNLKSEFVIGTSTTSEVTIFPGYDYKVAILFTDKEDMQRYFPDQTKKPPEFIINKNVAPPSSSSREGAGGGLVFFDVPPPPQSTPVTQK